ncbi:hypothetical protein MSAN_01686400 [Mycena sanguinolenta]|uniref:Uncharacterized protein n=1 Tax=Mycena sanguinolenta TaxID=230812 RepID=A0A8H6XYU1_9AGAR|nr:hypothetical protein MSAN_01686400 [Mycena sanguinolenta]
MEIVRLGYTHDEHCAPTNAENGQEPSTPTTKPPDDHPTPDPPRDRHPTSLADQANPQKVQVNRKYRRTSESSPQRPPRPESPQSSPQKRKTNLIIATSPPLSPHNSAVEDPRSPNPQHPPPSPSSSSEPASPTTMAPTPQQVVPMEVENDATPTQTPGPAAGSGAPPRAGGQQQRTNPPPGQQQQRQQQQMQQQQQHALQQQQQHALQQQQQQQQPRQQQPPPRQQQQQQQPPPQPPAIPTHIELMHHIPAGRGDNPHLRYYPAQPAPAVGPDGRPPYQRNNGTWPEAVFPTSRLFENVSQSVVDTVLANAAYFLAFIVYNGGQRVMSVYHNLLGDISQAIAGLATTAQVTLSRPQPVHVQEGNWGKKYMAPFVIFARFRDLAVKNRFLRQAVFAVNTNLAFIAVPIDPDVISWTVGIWKALASTADPHQLARELRAAIHLHMISCPAVIQKIAQITQGIVVGTELERAHAAADTIDVKYIHHERDPLFAVYIRPLTNDPKTLEELKALIRPRTFTYQLSSFTPKSPRRPPRGEHGAPPAPIDDDDEVPAPISPATHEWWGPPNQISQLKGGILTVSPAASTNGRGANHGSNNRGSTRGGRGNRGVRGGRGRSRGG